MPTKGKKKKRAGKLPESSLRDAQPSSEEKHQLLKFELAKKTDLFAPLPEDTLKMITSTSRDVVLQKDDILFEEGDLEKKMYIILSGKILISKGKNIKKRIAVLGPGEYLGEMALIDSKPRSATASAYSESLLMEIDEKLFHEQIVSNTQAILNMMKVFSSRMRNDLDAMAVEMQKLCNFTHDMRNCLVPLGIAEVLLKDVVQSLQGTSEGHKVRHGWEKVNKTFNTMMSVRDNLVVMIDQSLACVKKSKKEYLKAELEIRPLLEETVEEISCHKVLKNKDIRIETKGNIPKGFFNYLGIKRVLQNLLINAGHATGNDGNICVAAKALNDSIEISVTDNGAGIPDDVKEVLLKEVYTSKPDGNGFGLMSCKEIVEEFHQGRISFESELGRGTSFYFTIPQAVEELPILR